MKTKSKDIPVYFSHRPKAGVSIGVANQGNEVFVAISFTNNGMSYNGRYNRARRDSFSRPMARDIIKGRIKASMKVGRIVPFVWKQTTWQGFDLGKFTSELRKWFKPEPGEAYIENDWMNSTSIRDTEVIADAIFAQANKLAKQ